MAVTVVANAASFYSCKYLIGRHGGSGKESGWKYCAVGLIRDGSLVSNKLFVVESRISGAAWLENGPSHKGIEIEGEYLSLSV